MPDHMFVEFKSVVKPPVPTMVDGADPALAAVAAAPPTVAAAAIEDFDDDAFLFNQPYLYHCSVLNILLEIIRETGGKSRFLKNSLRHYLPCDYILFIL